MQTAMSNAPQPPSPSPGISPLKRNLLLVASYLAVLTLIAVGYR
jgi:hypothetical protein